MSRYPALLLDVELMAIEDIDGLHQESVRIHFGGGSCDASAHRRRVELLPPCYGSASRSLLCPYISPFICLFLSVYLLQEEEGAGKGKRGSDGGSNNISIPSSLQRLGHRNSKATPTLARPCWAVSGVSDEWLTRAVGPVMGSF